MVAPDSPDVKKRSKNDQQQIGRESLTYTVPPVEYVVSIVTGNKMSLNPNPMNPLSPLTPLNPVQVSVVTGNKMYAGTDAMVSMELVGTWGKAIHTFEQSKSLFEKGKADRFLVRIPECEQL